MVDENSREFLSLADKKDLAKYLGTNWGNLSFALYKLNNERKYKEFQINKRTGGVRIISAPISSLKVYQKKLNHVFQIIYKPKSNVFGFCLNKSILHNARIHTKQRFVLNIDIESFFDSINFGRVRGLFLSKPFNFNNEIATVLAQICCFKNKLPQGAPTSPVLSNLICWKLDKDFHHLATNHNLKYSRYADDITFSTYQKPFPESIATYNSINDVKLSENVYSIIHTNGFTVNESKVRIQTKSNRQEVTGLVVNKFPNVKRKYVRQIRAMLHSWREHGYENAEKEYFLKFNQRQTLNPINCFKNVIKGKIDFLGQIKGRDNSTYLRLLNSAVGLDPKFFRLQNKLSELFKEYNELLKQKHKGKKITVQKRGFIFESLINNLFKYFNIPVKDSFKRKGQGSQIDGAFSFDGWFYLTEIKWTKNKISFKELSSLKSKIDQSGKQTLGLFISINGWSSNVITGLKESSTKDILQMDGHDLESILNGSVSLDIGLKKKIEYLNLNANPFLKL